MKLHDYRQTHSTVKLDTGDSCVTASQSSFWLTVTCTQKKQAEVMLFMGMKKT